MIDNKNLLTVLVTAALLTACGGGGGNPGTVGGGTSGNSGTGSTGGTGGGNGGTSTAPAPTVNLSFVSASGATTNSLTSAAPLTVKATVLDASKKPVPNAIVTFATDNTLAVFSPTAGTALTDVNKVPLFGDIPVLGNLFKNTAKTDQKTELLVFITPKIVTERLQNGSK